MLYLSLLHFLLSLLPTAFTDWIFLVAPRCWRKLFCPVTMLGSKGHGMRDGVVKDSHQWGGGCGPQSSSFAGRASLLTDFCITWGLLDFYSECFLWKGMDCILNTGHILPSFRNKHSCCCSSETRGSGKELLCFLQCGLQAVSPQSTEGGQTEPTLCKEAEPIIAYEIENR